jgi:hypothetical protein
LAVNRARKGSVVAAKLLAQEDFRQAAQLDQETVNNLHKIARGVGVRNAMASIRSAEFLASFAYSKPKQEHEHSGDVTIRVLSAIAAAPSSEP